MIPAGLRIEEDTVNEDARIEDVASTPTGQPPGEASRAKSDAQAQSGPLRSLRIKLQEGRAITFTAHALERWQERAYPGLALEQAAALLTELAGRRGLFERARPGWMPKRILITGYASVPAPTPLAPVRTDGLLAATQQRWAFPVIWQRGRHTATTCIAIPGSAQKSIVAAALFERCGAGGLLELPEPLEEWPWRCRWCDKPVPSREYPFPYCYACDRKRKRRRQAEQRRRGRRATERRTAKKRTPMQPASHLRESFRVRDLR